jgi:oxygen-dependent protoporphyrinogen oxidase
MKSDSVIVVGGGLAGLTAAYYLQKAGRQVRIIEAGGQAGGRVATVRTLGYVLDVGATQMSSGYREYLALCDEVGLRSSIVSSSPYVGIIRHRRVYLIDGRRTLSGLFSPLLSLRGKLAVLRTIHDFIRLRPRVDPRDVSLNFAADVESCAAYAARRVGAEAYDALIDPLVRAYVINRGSNVSVLEWFSTLRILSGQTMLSMNRGNDTLPRRLASQLDIRLHCKATAINVDSAGVRVEIQNKSGVTEILHAAACVLATRLPEAIALHQPTRVAAGKLGEIARYNRGIVVHVGYSTRPECPAVGLLLGAVEHDEIGLIWLEHNKNTDRVPIGHALFTVYFDEAVADRCLDLPDDELVGIGSALLEMLFPELKGRRDLSHVTRWPLANLNPAPGVYRELHTMKLRLDPLDRVQLAGDYLTCVGQNSAVYYGKTAADRLLAQEKR